MKRLGHLWPRVVAFDNLFLAFRKALKGKRHRGSAAAFGLNLETELLAIQRELMSGEYRPGQYRLFTIYERKRRLIAAAPFRDRVVQHAVMNIIEPPLDQRFIQDSYACRKGKGVHTAVNRYQAWARRYAYVLKMDIQQYFPSIDHRLLKEKLRRRIKDPEVLKLLDRIIDESPPGPLVFGAFPGDDLLTPLERPAGIPIGNLTSQFFANLYLDDFDHWIWEQLNVSAYLRYVDDMIVLDNDKGRLHATLDLVWEKLAGERLHLHPHKAHIMPTRCGLDVLGFRVFPNRRRLRNGNASRFARRLRHLSRDLASGRISPEEIRQSIAAWVGHASHADTEGLRTRLLSGIVFDRGSAERPPGGSGRCLEQRTHQGPVRQP